MRAWAVKHVDEGIMLWTLDTDKERVMETLEILHSPCAMTGMQSEHLATMRFVPVEIKEVEEG